MKKTVVGTDNKDDCIVDVSPSKKLVIDLDTKNKGMFDAHIKDFTKKILTRHHIPTLHVVIKENGAVDYVIKARLEAALFRATGKTLVEHPVTRKPSPKARRRRTRLYVPGNNPRMIHTAGIYGSDCIIFDLEDSVAVDQKDAARFLIKRALCDLDFGDSELWVRVNKDTLNEDLAQVMQGSPHGICVPKVETGGDITRVEDLLKGYTGQVKLMPIIESAKGIMNALEIAGASPRIVAVAFGAEDLVRDLGGKRSWDTLFYARSVLVMAAKASGVQALDTIYSDVRDDQGLRKETLKIVAMGFDGKGVIHPEQITPIHECFAPTPEDIAQARAIIAALQEARTKGLGVASLEGKMIDEPVEKRARRILKMAE